MEGVQELTQAFGSLKWWAAGLLFLALLLWRFFAYIDKRADARESKEAEELKAKRAHEYTKALGHMGRSIDGLRTATDTGLKMVQQAVVTMNADLNEHQQAVVGVKQSVDELRAGARQPMPFAECVTIYEAVFSGIRREVLSLADDSLRDDPFADRPDYVNRKMRTSMGSAIATGRDRIRQVSGLSIDPSAIFKAREVEGPTDLGSGAYQTGERFILCDRLWKVLEPQYVKIPILGLKAVIAETRVALENAISDYLHSVIRRAQQQAEEAVKAAVLYSKTIRTKSGEWTV